MGLHASPGTAASVPTGRRGHFSAAAIDGLEDFGRAKGPFLFGQSGPKDSETFRPSFEADDDHTFKPIDELLGFSKHANLSHE